MSESAPAAAREGNWHRRTWRLAGPVMISNVSVPLLGAVDTAVIGRLPGPEFMGAVAVGALIFTVAYHGCNFLRMGTTGLTAQSYGAGDADEVRGWLACAGAIAVAIGAAVILLQVPVLWLALHVVQPSAEVAPHTATYFAIRVWGAPAALFNYAVLGWFFGVQDARAALVTQVFMNGINIVLDIWFVLGLGLGVAGVAWATLIAEVSTVGLSLLFVVANLRRVGGHLPRHRVLDRGRLGRMFRVNGDIFIRGLCVQTVFIVITGVGGRIGDTVLAANAVLLNFFIFSSHALDGFANATEALCGEAIGARRRDRFVAAVKATTLWAAVFAAAFTAAFLALGTEIVALLTTVPEVRLAAAEYLPWAMMLPAVSVWSFQLDGVFIGSTWTAEMRNGMIISTAVFGLAATALLGDLGNHALWLALTLWMTVRALTLAAVAPRLQRRIAD